VRLVDLRPKHLDELYAAMRKIGRTDDGERPSPMLRRLLDARGAGATSRRPISPGRMRRVHAVICAYLTDRTRREMIARNPAAHVELPSGRAPRALVWTPERVNRWLETGRRPSPVMVWTPEQTGLFLDFAAEDQHYAFWHLTAFRGLRRGEGCGLDRTDLDLDGARCTIRASLDEAEAETGGQTLGDTKTHRDRTIALDATTVSVLKAQHRRQLQDKLRWGSLWVNSGLVFTKQNGEPLVPDTVSQHFDRLVARYEAIRRAPERAASNRRKTPTAEALAATHHMPVRAIETALTGPPLPPIRLHDLRHVAACLAYRATKDLKLVSQLMGHSGIQITADIYTSLFE